MFEQYNIILSATDGENKLADCRDRMTDMPKSTDTDKLYAMFTFKYKNI